jgi:putative membrane protein
MSETPAGSRPSSPLDPRTQLAYQRTFLAHERTQMAWIRTALALISFGFTIAEVFELLRDKAGDAGPKMAPRAIGIVMISIGLIALSVSTAQHSRAVRRLRFACPDLPRSLSWGTALLIAMLGLLALLGAIFRM